MGALPLAFATPLLLTALVALPVLWWLLRLTPPAPTRLPLPTLPIVQDLVPREETPARTPPWLLLLRLLMAAAVILAMAGPIWNPRPRTGGLDGPVLILVDGGWSAAPGWRAMADRAAFLATTARSAGRPAALVDLADAPAAVAWSTGAAVLERVRALKPQPHTAERAAHAKVLDALLKEAPGGSGSVEIDWITDGVGTDAKDGFTAYLRQAAPGRVLVHAEPAPTQLALTGAANEPDGLAVKLVRAGPAARAEAILRALDARGRALGETRASFAGTATEADARFDLPLELRNEVTRVEIAGEGSAGAVTLLDANDRRRRVGIVSGESLDTAQPLLSAAYYVARALAPYADLRQPPRGAAEGIGRVVEDGASVMILTDIGSLVGPALEQATRFVENGGVLLRFASTQATAPTDDLVPVRLRRTGRTLGSTLSWEKPQHLAPFAEASPFWGLSVPTDVTVNRQLLAEPEPSLAGKTWAALEDGTPLVTGAKRGKGLIALIHVPPDLQWSNLALSGLFVDMLRKLVMLSPSGQVTDTADEGGPRIAPTRVLDGAGAFTTPPVTAKPIPAGRRAPATLEHPPGFYGPPEATVAINTLPPGAKLTPIAFEDLPVRSLVDEKPLDLRPALLTLALALFLVDALAVMLLAGALPRLLRRGAGMAAGGAAKAAMLLLLGLALFQPDLARAQTTPAPPAPAAPAPEITVRPEDLRSALVTRLAYVITGDREIDETSRMGLASLTRALGARTAFEPGDPIGVDPARDELVFYPLLYWPIAAARPLPTQAAIQRLDDFMKNGGIVLFDTRDAYSTRLGRDATPETRRLREILATIDVPELEPVRREHVINKTFYLLDAFVGRYNNGQTWIEALPPEGLSVKDSPAQGGDRVSPIIITSNDLAAAWATDRSGQPRYSLNGSDPRQREMALRGGINISMYAMTGNYKSDQQHVPALLERLGQ